MTKGLNLVDTVSFVLIYNSMTQIQKKDHNTFDAAFKPFFILHEKGKKIEKLKTNAEDMIQTCRLFTNV